MAVMLLSAWLPEIGFVPVHAPEAVQEAALVLVQVSVEPPPEGTEVGFAVNVSVGAGLAARATVTDWPVEPPAPVHERLKVDVALITGDCSEPDAGLLPAHAPEAVQPVAFCELHVSVDRPPTATDVGFALNETVGAGTMLTVTER